METRILTRNRDICEYILGDCELAIAFHNCNWSKAVLGKLGQDREWWWSCDERNTVANLLIYLEHQEKRLSNAGPLQDCYARLIKFIKLNYENKDNN